MSRLRGTDHWDGEFGDFEAGEVFDKTKNEPGSNDADNSQNCHG